MRKNIAKNPATKIKHTRENAKRTNVRKRNAKLKNATTKSANKRSVMMSTNLKPKLNHQSIDYALLS